MYFYNNLQNIFYVLELHHKNFFVYLDMDYLGLDIIITEDGMKLCEINSHPAIDYEQIMCGPVLKREKIRTFFEHKGLFNYDGKALYEAYMRCQKD